MAGDEQTKNVLPAADSDFLATLRTFLREEDAERFTDMFAGFVAAGGTHGTGAGLTGTPAALTAYPGGFLVTETGSITYAANETTFVIAHKDTTGDVGTYTRVAGTHYLIDDVSAAEPALPADSVRLMTVTTDATDITAVTDRRVVVPTTADRGGTGLNGSNAVGDLLYGDASTTFARLLAVADGNVLRSAGLVTAPLWGKVRLAGATTDISGVLPRASGGTDNDGAPVAGDLLIGDGTTGGWVKALLTQGANITITNADGSITIAATLANAAGTYGSRGQLSLNNAVTPNTQFDLDADVVTLRNTSDETVVRFDPGAALTNDVTLAGPAANGRDQAGAFSADSWVHFYWIWNGTTLATLSSLAAPPTGPTLPATYTHWAYAGAVRFNGSSQLVRTRIYGDWAFYESGQAALTGGAATVETAISLTSLVPPNVLQAQLYFEYLSASMNAPTLRLRAVTGSDFLTVDRADVAAGGRAHGTVHMPTPSQQIFYLLNTGGAPSLDVEVLAYRLPNGGV